MESWEDENVNSTTPQNQTVAANKWQGEDEDEDVKESWEDEDEEKPVVAPPKIDVPQKKPTLTEKIADRERVKREAREKLEKEIEETELTAEEQLKRQKDSDLNLALDTTFGNSAFEVDIFHVNLPDKKEDYPAFTEFVSQKLLLISKSSEYPGFVENLMRNLCASLSSTDIKGIKITLDKLCLEKQKMERSETSNKKSKTKGKVKLNVDEKMSDMANEDYYEYEDFM